MNTDLNIIFIEIAKDLNIPESIIQEPLKTLNSNFFFKLQDIKRINNDTWTKLNLPLNLFYILQDKISLIENGNSSISSTLTSSDTITITNNVQPTRQIEQQLQLTHQSKSESEEKSNAKSIQNVYSNSYSKEDSLESVVEDIMKEAKVQSEITSTLKILYTIIENIIKSPLDQSVHRINTSSKSFISRISPYKSTLRLLSFAGFVYKETSEGKFWVFEGKYDSLKAVMSSYALILKSKNIVKSDFNPYSTYISSLSNTDNSSNQSSNQSLSKGIPEWDKLLRQLKETRQKIIESSLSCERNIQIYNTNSKANSQNMNTEKSILEMNQSEIEEYDFLLYAKNILKESRDDKFKIRSRIEFERLSDEKICTYSVIKLKFKNEFILQACFALQEKIKSIYDLIYEHLDLSLIGECAKEMTIQSAYPNKKYVNNSKSIYDEGLYPNVLLYVNLNFKDGLLKEIFKKESLLKFGDVGL